MDSNISILIIYVRLWDNYQNRVYCGWAFVPISKTNQRQRRKFSKLLLVSYHSRLVIDIVIGLLPHMVLWSGVHACLCVYFSNLHEQCSLFTQMQWLWRSCHIFVYPPALVYVNVYIARIRYICMFMNVVKISLVNCVDL